MTAVAPAIVAARLGPLMSGILELTQRAAKRFDLLLVGALLDFDIVEHFRDLLQITKQVVELVDHSQHFA